MRRQKQNSPEAQKFQEHKQKSSTKMGSGGTSLFLEKCEKEVE
jgi:hypothetical protein